MGGETNDEETATAATEGESGTAEETEEEEQQPEFVEVTKLVRKLEDTPFML